MKRIIDALICSAVLILIAMASVVCAIITALQDEKNKPKV